MSARSRSGGVSYFTRHGRGWNQPPPPFQAKTKAGNVNAWLDHVQTLALDYEVFVQLDIDHRPRPDYLDRVLGYFRDRRSRGSKPRASAATSTTGPRGAWPSRT